MDIRDVENRILTNLDNVDTDGLQIVLYYTQALSLVRNGKPLMEDEFYASSFGPVTPKLENLPLSQRMSFNLKVEPSGNPLDPEDIALIDEVCEHYGKFNIQELGTMIRASKPWLDARSESDLVERRGKLIPKSEIAEYYKNSAKCDLPNILPKSAIKDLTTFQELL